MKTNLASWSRGRLIAVIAAGLVLLLLVGVGVYGLITGPRPPEDRAPDPAPTVTAPGETEPAALPDRQAADRGLRVDGVRVLQAGNRSPVLGDVVAHLAEVLRELREDRAADGVAYDGTVGGRPRVSA